MISIVRYCPKHRITLNINCSHLAIRSVTEIFCLKKMQKLFWCECVCFYTIVITVHFFTTSRDSLDALHGPKREGFLKSDLCKKNDSTEHRGSICLCSMRRLRVNITSIYKLDIIQTPSAEHTIHFINT